MKVINVALKENRYKILIGHNILSQLGPHLKRLKLGTDALIVTNPGINRRYGKKVSASLIRSGFKVKVFQVPQGEKSKSAKGAFELIERIERYSVMKKVFIVALGGGVVGDLAGYVAAAYRRGIPYAQVPTTFLAQIDSAIGGKVGIDLPIGKNLVGAFYQPKLVYTDLMFLSTLDRRQIRNGLAEALKYGVIADLALFSYIERNYQKLLKGDVNTLLYLVVACSRIKTDVVVRDEKETKGIRSILNFGHTVGHAIEAAGRYKAYQHGEAIALGMRVAAEISHALKLLSRKEVIRLNTLLSDVGLPQVIKGVSVPKILSAMSHDKKFESGKNRFVVATKIGKVKLVSGVPASIIKKAIKTHS